MRNREQVKADAFHIPLKARSVQAVITSSPYWSLRKYNIEDIKINNWKGQYGWEPTVEMYVEHTMLWIREVWRVLKSDGVFFLNMGDTYGGSWQNHSGPYRGKERPAEEKPPCRLAKSKCKLLIPHRVAIALIDWGWTCRNDIIWHKPTAIPESVQDRFSRRFEYVFMFVKNPKYYFNLDAVKEKYKRSSIERAKRESKSERCYDPTHFNSNRRNKYKEKLLSGELNGKNPGDIWTIRSQNYSGGHYSTFPEKLAERMILCSTRPGDIVLDPFGGSGTTGRVAIKLGRKSVLLDLGYHHLQKERTNNVQIEMEAIV